MTTLPVVIEGTVKIAGVDVPAVVEDEGGSFFAVGVPDDVELDEDCYRFESEGSERPFAVRHLVKDEAGGEIVYKYVCQWTAG